MVDHLGAVRLPPPHEKGSVEELAEVGIAAFRSLFAVWLCLAESVAHVLEMDPKTVLFRMRRENKRPSQKVYDARRLLVHAMVRLVGLKNTRMWARLVLNMGQQTMKRIIDKPPESGTLDAVLGITRTAIRKRTGQEYINKAIHGGWV